MKDKKDFKDTSFGRFLNKAKDLVPEVLNIAGKVVTGNYIGAVQEVGILLKSKSEKDQRVKSLLIEFEQYKMQFEKDCFEMESADRKDARSLYSLDGIIQKILAILFTSGYFAITYYLFSHFITKKIELSEFEIGFISTIFGGMSTKVNTIIDFFFGGSVQK